jgi:phosphatidate cytidylyltransferase
MIKIYDMSNLQYALIGLILLLATASIIFMVKRFSFPSKNDAEVMLRLRSWWVMVGMFVFAIAAGFYITIIFFSFISYIALKEYFTIANIRPAHKSILWLAYASIPIQYASIAINYPALMMVFIPVLMLLLLLLNMVIIGETQSFLSIAAKIHCGLMLTVFFISHAASLMILPANKVANASLVFFLVFLTQFNDVLQYIWGKLLGVNNKIGSIKIVKSISPNKTLAGFLGGVLTTTLLAYLIAPFLTNFQSLQSIIAGLVISLGGFLGDVILSAIKRDAGVKDTSQLIPGHGGILDRIDSLIVTAPLFYWLFYY